MNKLKINVVLIILIISISCSSDEDENYNTNLSNGLIGQILLNGNAVDSSGNISNGEVLGNVNPTTNRKGDENMAMEFNENEGHINFGNINELEINYQSSISISVWINPNGNQIGWDTILNQFFGGGPSPSVNGRFYLGLNPENQKLKWYVFGYTLESSMVISISEWTHIVVNYENRKISMYINGTLNGTHEFNVNDGQRALGTGAPFRIGKQSMTTSNTTGFNGEIDDIYIFNRILEQNEITALFEK